MSDDPRARFAPRPGSLAVLVATAGRAALARRTLERLATGQDAPPEEVLVCPAPEDALDLGSVPAGSVPMRRVDAPRGSCPQRNALIRASVCELGLFLDDDFLAARDYARRARELFATHPDIVCATGHVIADGVGVGGFDLEHGERLLAADPGVGAGGPRTTETYAGYGCNMVVRLDLLRSTGIRFDETLPAYAWQEDVDLSRQLARHGRVVHHDGLRGVHLGTTSGGRTPGRRLGYSQIANPAYLVAKGTLARPRALRLVAGNVAANIVRAPLPEPWIDRRGRLVGNLVAGLDLVRGRLHPGRAMRL